MILSVCVCVGVCLLYVCVQMCVHVCVSPSKIAKESHRHRAGE